MLIKDLKEFLNKLPDDFEIKIITEPVPEVVPQFTVIEFVPE